MPTTWANQHPRVDYIVTAQIIRAILFASATAATIFGLRATSAASQRFSLPPLRTTQRITLMAPTIIAFRLYLETCLIT